MSVFKNWKLPSVAIVNVRLCDQAKMSKEQEKKNKSRNHASKKVRCVDGGVAAMSAAYTIRRKYNPSPLSLIQYRVLVSWKKSVVHIDFGFGS